MESQRVDVAVVGCGGAGAAAAWWLARRGRSVVAIDRFEPGHVRGSSHGTERIVRAAYADPVYVEMALAALPLWRELEREIGVDLLTVTGGIDFGDVEELAEIVATCRAAGVATEELDAAEARRRFPGFRFDGPVLHQPGTATIHADRAVVAMQRAAIAHGASVHFDEQVVAVEPGDDDVVVRSTHRQLRADVCVVTAGAWASGAVGDMLPLPEITVTQEQVAYFATARSGWPAFIARGDPPLYGLPTPGGSVKVGEHFTGPVVDPDDRTFAVEPIAWERMLMWVREHLPGVDPNPVASTTCLYASAPAEKFVLDRIGRVVVGAGLGGHGFKFLPEIGRRLADLADGLDVGSTTNPFRLDSPRRSVPAPRRR